MGTFVGGVVTTSGHVVGRLLKAASTHLLRALTFGLAPLVLAYNYRPSSSFAFSPEIGSSPGLASRVSPIRKRVVNRASPVDSPRHVGSSQRGLPCWIDRSVTTAASVRNFSVALLSGPVV